MTSALPFDKKPYRLMIRVIHILLTFTIVLSDTDDAKKLVTFKESLSNSGALNNWTPDGLPCNGSAAKWTGIKCDKDGTVLGLQLENMGLSGTIDMDTLAELTTIRTLSFANNSFRGTMPNIQKIRLLRSIYLSDNGFSGEIGDNVFSGMNSMRKIELQNNNFTGKIPKSLTRLSKLVELDLGNNKFEGKIPNFKQKELKVNFANNNLDGPIPKGLKNQDPSSFAGNNVCGEPLNNRCKKNTRKTIIIIVVALVVALAVISITLFIFRARRRPKNAYKNHQTTKLDKNNAYHANKNEIEMRNHEEIYKRGENGGKLQFVRDDRERFELQDLLRASAEILGSGSFGSSYKATLLGGPVVVVKRFREMSNVGKEQFYEHLRRLGGFSHPNLLPLVAFYYQKDEKLLINDFAQNGSLASHLHGKRQPNEPGLDWPTRLNIIKGVAKGLGYLYKELPHISLPHGHLKSSNVLLDNAFNPLLADYALVPLMNKDHAQQYMVAYKSPEFSQHGRTAKKTDVWCLGILILEMLTGKFPANYLKRVKGGNSDLETWVNSVVREEWTGEVFDKEMKGTKNGEGEMLRLLKIGMCCSESNVEKRWDLKEAVEKIEELKDRDNDEEYSSYQSEGDVYSSRAMTDDDFSFSKTA